MPFSLSEFYFYVFWLTRRVFCYISLCSAYFERIVVINCVSIKESPRKVDGEGKELKKSRVNWIFFFCHEHSHFECKLMFTLFYFDSHSFCFWLLCETNEIDVLILIDWFYGTNGNEVFLSVFRDWLSKWLSFKWNLIKALRGFACLF